ncbi:MAG: peptidoglycan editing factor PgeF [Gammaproteobacteria bacterium]|nr:peptidoglycan editing factor PgeF [Gammaproteobacteria bacterium]
MADRDAWIVPDWPAPAAVRAVVTTRAGGTSTGPYATWNLGDHVGDDPAAVAANRALLGRVLGAAGPVLWLRQVHGTRVIPAHRWRPGIAADGSWCDGPGPVCAVLTADCLPVLLCRRDGGAVAAVHAGWRGLAAGVIEAAVAALGDDPGALLAWLGPAIGAAAYEVDGAVRDAFVASDEGAAGAFTVTRPGHWRADLDLLARRRLAEAGIEAVHGGGYCTASDDGRFFSYRRDGVTGRMASLVWIAGADAG